MRLSAASKAGWIVPGVILLFCLGNGLGCPPKKGDKEAEPLDQLEPLGEDEQMEKDRKYFIENVGGIAVVQLYADEFEKLPISKKMLAYYLYQAAVAGRDIAYDQNHAQALTIRGLMDQILTHPLGLAPEVEAKMVQYAKMLWLNNGPYWDRNKTKFLAPFTREEFLEALGIAKANGSDFSFFPVPLEQAVLEIDPVLFDPRHQPLVTNKNPGPDGDILRDSANNYYKDVVLKDLDGFQEKYPLNSRLVKECPKKKPCKVVEQVYRCGKKDPKGKKWLVEPGLYAPQLEKVISYLEKALLYAEGTQAETIAHLIEYFRTGDNTEFDKASIAWLKTDADVDFILGFIETYKDPRSQKAEFEGLVYYKDLKSTSIMKGIADHAAYFEERSPWADEYKKKDIKVPVAAAINVLVGVGGAGPNVPAGINLPNAQWIREQHGSRSVLLTNVLQAGRAAVSDKALEEFALPDEVPYVRRYREAVGRTMVALHEIVGHGSGKASPKLDKDPSAYLKETYSTLEEARAELVALHHIFDPKLVEIGALPNDQAPIIAYADYIRGDLIQLRRIKEGNRIEDDHMRAIHLIVQFIMANSAAVERKKTNGKTYVQLKDVNAAREAVRKLLAEVMRIKAEGDLDAARALVEKYAITFDAELRNEVVKRAAEAGVPDFVAFHVPAVKLVYDADGKPIDVAVDYGKEFLGAMLEWDIMGPQ